MEAIGAPGVGLVIAAENLFPPIPSEIVLPLAGFTASRGDFTLAEALLWSTAGSLVGAFILYGSGALLGIDRLRAVARRMPLVEVSDVDKTTAWFRRHGAKTVFFGRLLPIFRSLISIPAGITRLNLLLFAVLTFTGSALWNTLLVLAGYLLGENWAAVEPFADVLQYVVLGAVVVVIVAFVVIRLRRRGRPAESEPSA
ncbi:DedA family protein [Pseudolysinimonas sp.]|uniref:DedA family protein n=1 Tax=Pseudolysinimonas sp. TaxID=2680009 RepID=UPI00378421F6